ILDVRDTLIILPQSVVAEGVAIGDAAQQLEADHVVEEGNGVAPWRPARPRGQDAQAVQLDADADMSNDRNAAEDQEGDDRAGHAEKPIDNSLKPAKFH